MLRYECFACRVSPADPTNVSLRKKKVTQHACPNIFKILLSCACILASAATQKQAEKKMMMLSGGTS